jgi:hypothetical protein
MSKLVPKKYGDRIMHAGDQDAPIQHVVGKLDLDRLSAGEGARRPMQMAREVEQFRHS